MEGINACNTSLELLKDPEIPGRRRSVVEAAQRKEMITAGKIHPLCHELTERRAHLLLPRRTADIVKTLGKISAHWLDPNNPWRQRAIEGVPRVGGFSAPMTERIIDLLFAELTEEKLGALVEAELGKLKDKQHGPPLIAQIFSGNIPNAAVVSLVCGLLVKSASFCKASSRDPLFPMLYLASLHEADPDLAGCVQVQRWKGGGSASEREGVGALERALFHEAGLVVAYGDDSSLRSLQSLMPSGKPFLGFGHKIGFAIVAKDAVDIDACAANAAGDVSLYDQQGCLSPHVIFVEERGPCSPPEFAERLATAMDEFNCRFPRGKLSLEESAALARVRSAYEFRAAGDRGVGCWGSEGTDAWTVICEDDPMFATSPLNRVVFVKPLRDLEQSIAHLRQFVHNVGLACSYAAREEWEARLRRLGAARVCPLGQMQKPPLNFADGIRPRLRDLISIKVF